MKTVRNSALQAVSFSALATALLLSACAPDLGPKPQLEAPQALATDKSFADATGEWPADKWWVAYGDLELNTLEDEALQGSPDLRIAEARLREAQASAQRAGADLVPNLSLDASSQS